MTTPPPDDVLTSLREEHREIARRLVALDSAMETRAEEFRKLTDELSRHEASEERVVYPILMQLPGGLSVADARIAEQAELEQQLARMERVDIESHEFRRELASLKAAVMAHANNEERHVFPLLASLSSAPLVHLGQKYVQVKKAAPSHPHPHAPGRPPANKLFGPITGLIDRIRDSVNGLQKCRSDQDAPDKQEVGQWPKSACSSRAKKASRAGEARHNSFDPFISRRARSSFVSRKEIYLHVR